MPAIPLWLWATGGGFAALNVFGKKRDDSLLDDLTPIIAIGVAGFAIYALAKK